MGEIGELRIGTATWSRGKAHTDRIPAVHLLRLILELSELIRQRFDDRLAAVLPFASFGMR